MLSICVPTFNRPGCLENCLNSIQIAKKNFKIKFNVCISDNSAKNINYKIIKKYKRNLSITYKKNKKNIGRVLNMIQAVKLSNAKFIWLIGDDDLLMPNSFKIIKQIISKKKNKDVDFFYFNSACIDSKYIFSKKHPFNTNMLPKKLKKFSLYDNEKKLKFYQLINPNISFDFLGGMFLSIFKREMWNKNKNTLNKNFIRNTKTFTNFDNTFPHIKIFAKAFMRSNAYFCKRITSVNLSGIREWNEYWPLIQSVRMIEMLENYRINGLSLWRYFYCKNFALRNFLPDYFKLIINRKKLGLTNINFTKLFFKNLLYPNVYLSIFYFIIRKIFKKK